MLRNILNSTASNLSGVTYMVIKPVSSLIESVVSLGMFALVSPYFTVKHFQAKYLNRRFEGQAKSEAFLRTFFFSPIAFVGKSSLILGFMIYRDFFKFLSAFKRGFIEGQKYGFKIFNPFFKEAMRDRLRASSKAYDAKFILYEKLIAKNKTLALIPNDNKTARQKHVQNVIQRQLDRIKLEINDDVFRDYKFLFKFLKIIVAPNTLPRSNVGNFFERFMSDFNNWIKHIEFLTQTAAEEIGLSLTLIQSRVTPNVIEDFIKMIMDLPEVDLNILTTEEIAKLQKIKIPTVEAKLNEYITITQENCCSISLNDLTEMKAPITIAVNNFSLLDNESICIERVYELDSLIGFLRAQCKLETPEKNSLHFKEKTLKTTMLCGMNTDDQIVEIYGTFPLGIIEKLTALSAELRVNLPQDFVSTHATLNSAHQLVYQTVEAQTAEVKTEPAVVNNSLENEIKLEHKGLSLN